LLPIAAAMVTARLAMLNWQLAYFTCLPLCEDILSSLQQITCSVYKLLLVIVIFIAKTSLQSFLFNITGVQIFSYAIYYSNTMLLNIMPSY